MFSTKILIGDNLGDGTTVSRGHPRHAKVKPLAVQKQNLHFSVILRP